ncbi:MAG: leucyl aminopeptidase [Tistrella sp.]|uniref:Leucyl aminopeptidase n=1 Tax=Tistrella mobilis TaxID=171437 RepID=A0A3B9ID67_9PROT|nr:leucyl aminopeptidase family protein [Tistrella sp.]MAD36986.1 leucyl aminopeptidase [Tistrella sp.]MBA75099.1 leucyl aminopeptidase [Tistrella sp.]MBA79135.1 leucyl aminopeptidase [Tistrella sp.]HAE45782.1 leucyl aminopeptidase [Tistrella mobilis]
MAEIPSLSRDRDAAALPLTLVTERDFAAWRDAAEPRIAAWLSAQGFKPRQGAHALLPDAEGGIAGAVMVTAAEPGPWAIGDLAQKLPEGRWRLDPEPTDPRLVTNLAMGWALGAYRFDRYLGRTEDRRAPATLVVPAAADQVRLAALVQAISHGRDLINTPAEDMGPHELALAARRIAENAGGRYDEIVGDNLVQRNFPAIHAVGRASTRPPRLIDFSWGDESHPRVTLVGKGVCFDSGGLDIKPASAMRLMKKDMGGAAHVLALARMIIDTNLPVRLRVLIPTVDNVIAGDAFRPGDVLKTRAGISVEVGDTDAEGRLILADALAEAARDMPELLIDVATLTGAARVAVGTEIAAFFAEDDALAAALESAARTEDDPVWRLPLHRAYRHMLDSKIADICNVSGGGFAGATTAALFLDAFAGEARKGWLHLDLMAWNTRNRPGRPEGGEIMGVRALYRMIADRWAPSA